MSLRRIVLMLPLSVVLSGCFERTQPSVDSSPRPVQAVRVTLADTADVREYPGTIRPRREADLGFRAPGRIVARRVDVGDWVARGQELARLDPADLMLAVRGAEADLRAAEAQDRQASADAGRSRTLLAQGWVAVAADDAKQTAARSAREKVMSARAELELARNRLDYGVLRAAANGIVTAVIADPGTVVAEGQAVLRLAEAGAAEVEVALPEAVVIDEFGGERRNAPASVTLWARPGDMLTARLRELSPTADQRLRTYLARYAIDDAPSWVAFGMSATLRLGRTSREQVALLPTSAISDRGDGPAVWVIDPDTGAIKARPVAVRALRQERTLVSGLQTGELVVALGVQKLDPQTRVKIADIRPVTE